MGFFQSIDGDELIRIPRSDYIPDTGWDDGFWILNYSLKDIYNNIKTVKSLTGDHLLIAKLDYKDPYWVYRVHMIPITSDINLFTNNYLNEYYNSPLDNSSNVYIDIGIYNMHNRNYDGSANSQNNYGQRTYGNWTGWEFVAYQYSSYPYSSYAYTPSWDNANGKYKIYFNKKLPLKYNYKPLDYIFGNNSNLKLSMIKEEFTNGGKTVEFKEPVNIQRFTDKTNLHTILKSLPIGIIKILGYTDDNNYVALSKKYETDTVKGGVIQYYIDGIHQPNLDFEINMQYTTLDVEFHYYLSYLVDVENKACRQSIIMFLPSSNNGFYNKEENDRKIITEEYQTLMYEWLSTSRLLEPSDDPNEQGGTSNTGGGSGEYNNIGDDIPLPLKPLVSVADANFITVYNPTMQQIKSLAKYMWGSGFSLESFKKIFSDPMDCIIGLHLLPCQVPNSGVQNVKVGNISSPVMMNVVTNQFVDVDCGSIKIDEYWGSYLDYSPYTKINIYLPYIGTSQLEVDDVMNKTVAIKYRIDVITGACTCFIIVNGIVMYQYNSSCLATVPISSQDYRTTLSSIIAIGVTAIGVGASVANSGGIAVATGGALLPLAGASIAKSVMNSKPSISHGNSASGTGGFMSIQTPYITITRARQCLPKSQNTFTGYPSYTTKKLSTLKGFTKIEEIHLDSLSCTEVEREEIETLLKGGVIL